MPHKRWLDRLLGDRKRLLLLMKEFNFVQEYDAGRGHLCYLRIMRKVRKLKEHKPTHLNVLTGMHHWRKHQVEMRRQLQELGNVTGGKNGTASQSVEASKEKMSRKAYVDRLLDDRKFLIKMLMKHSFLAEEGRGAGHACLESLLYDLKKRKPSEYEIQRLLRYWRNNESELRNEISQKLIPKTWIEELIDDRKLLLKWLKRFNFVDLKDSKHVYSRCVEMLKSYRNHNPTHFEVIKLVNYWNKTEATLRKELLQDTRKSVESSTSMVHRKSVDAIQLSKANRKSVEGSSMQLSKAIKKSAENNTMMNVMHTNLNGPGQSISEHSSLPLVPVLNDEQIAGWKSFVQREFPTIYMGTKVDSLIKGTLTTPSLDALGAPPSKKPHISVQESVLGGKQLVNAAGDSVIYPPQHQQSTKNMEMKKRRPSTSENPLPPPTIPNQSALAPFHSNQHLPRQDFSQAHLKSSDMSSMVVGSLSSLASGSSLHSSKNIPTIDFHNNNNNVSRTVGPMGSGIPFYPGKSTPVKDHRGNVPGMVVGSMENSIPFHPSINMYGRDFQGMNGSNVPRTIGPVIPATNPFMKSKPFRGIKDDNVASMVVGTLGTSNLTRLKNQMKNQGFSSSIPSNVNTVGKQSTVKGKDLLPDDAGKRSKQEGKGNVSLQSDLTPMKATLTINKLKKQMEADLGTVLGATLQPGSKAPSPAAPPKKKSVKSLKSAESDQSSTNAVDTKPKKKTKNFVKKAKDGSQNQSKSITPAASYKAHKHRRISASNGVEVEFEDGVRMIVKRRCDITFIDDEPIRTWDLKPGTTVAVKYSDGFVYDAVVIGSVGRKTADDKPPKPSVIVENSAESHEQDESWEPKNMKLPENPMQWRCLKCCLVFRAYEFIKLHQTTVCQGPVVKVVKHIEFEENSLVTVDDDPHMWRPELKKLKIELLPGFSKNNFNFLKGARILHKWESEDGIRWYKGKVTSVTEKKGDDIIPEDTPVFEVWYADDERDRGPYDLKLLDDYPKDLRIVSLENPK